MDTHESYNQSHTNIQYNKNYEHIKVMLNKENEMKKKKGSKKSFVRTLVFCPYFDTRLYYILFCDVFKF